MQFGGMEMNISEIETFLMIVKTKNITKTAENLFLSQPTVSHRLKSLEEELGVKLIARKKGHKQIELTSQGDCGAVGGCLAGNAASETFQGKAVSDRGVYGYAQQRHLL